MKNQKTVAITARKLARMDLKLFYIPADQIEVL